MKTANPKSPKGLKSVEGVKELMAAMKAHGIAALEVDGLKMARAPDAQPLRAAGALTAAPAQTQATVPQARAEFAKLNEIQRQRALQAERLAGTATGRRRASPGIGSGIEALVAEVHKGVQATPVPQPNREPDRQGPVD